MRNLLGFILASQFAMLIAVLLDIPIARQIIGFIYLSFIPGILILGILRLNLKSRIHVITFSVGLSIAFLMFVGLVVNELYPLASVSKPLSILPLSATIGTVLLVMTYVVYKRGDLASTAPLPSIDQLVRALLLIGVPLLAIFGALLTNSLILLLMVIAVVVLVVATVFCRKLVPFEMHIIVIMVIAASLLFQKEFVSKYLVGYDVFGEFYVFRLANAGSSWNAGLSSGEPTLLNYNAMLSITILPVIYSKLLNMQGEWVFKVVYLLLYSLVPVSVYQMYYQRFGRLAAFLSTFYFMLFPRFYNLSSRREMIGELFLVLLIFLIIDRGIERRKRQILLTIFGAALIVSHYSLSYIYLFWIFFIWFSMTLMGKHQLTRWNLRTSKTVMGGFVLLLFIMTFSWYTYVSVSPSTTFLDLIDTVSGSFFTDFLNPESRGGIYEAISPVGPLSLAEFVDYTINKLSYLFIAIGVVCLFKNFKQKQLDWEYGLMVLASASIVLLVMAVPHLASAFLADRFYHVTLFCLAPVCILGGKTFFEWCLKPLAPVCMKTCKKVMPVHALNLRLMCIFLVTILLFKVGFVYEVVGDIRWASESISFMRMKTSDNNETRASFYESYVPEQDILSAIWLSEMAGKNSKIYADRTAVMRVLRGYGMIVVEWNHVLSNNRRVEGGGYIYLRQLNVEGILREQTVEPQFSVADFSHLLYGANKIYSNGNSEVYLSLPSNSTA